MPTASEWTYEQYAALPDDGNKYEVIDGEVRVTTAAGTRHQKAGANLYIALDSYVNKHGLGEMFWDVDLLFVSGQYLRPDMLFVPAARVPGMKERGVESTPGLVIEVVSPGSSRYDRVLKPKRYRDFGVPEYWVLDPAARVIEQYRLSEPANRPIICSQTMHWQPDVNAPPLDLPVATIFSSSLFADPSPES